MRIIISGKKMDVSDYLRQLVEKKANKLNRYFNDETDVFVTLSIEKSRHIAEITVPFDGVVLRTQESSGDMYASIDAALKKLERMIRKHRTKLEKRLHENAFESAEPLFGEDVDDFGETEARIVRVKKFPMKPMSVEEAQMQIELVGHSFFVFMNSATNEVNVLYKRMDGDYGLIEPENK